MVKIDFSFSSQYGTFSDALHLPDDYGLSDKQIEAMKQARFDNWIAVVTAPPPYHLFVLDTDGNIVVDADGNPVMAE